MKRAHLTFIALGLIVALVMPAPLLAQDGPDPDETRTITEILAARSNDPEASEFNTLLTLIQTADSAVFEALADPNSTYTLLAPTDAAFGALSRRIDLQVYQQIVTDPVLLTGVLLYHMLPADYGDTDFAAFIGETGLVTVPTSLGQSLDLQRDEAGTITIDGIAFEATAIPAANGTIFQLDAVLLPEVATVGEVLDRYINDEDVEFFGTYLASALAAVDEELVTDLDRILGDTPANPNALTFFAPTEAALNDLVLAGTFSEWLNDTDIMTARLQYHMLPDAYSSYELAAAIEEAGGTLELASVAGDLLVFTFAEDGSIRINDTITIIDFDIDAVNGTIHVIDTVLQPPSQ